MQSYIDYINRWDETNKYCFSGARAKKTTLNRVLWYNNFINEIDKQTEQFFKTF